MCKDYITEAGKLGFMNKKETRWYSKALSIAGEKHNWTRSDLVREIAKVIHSSESSAYAWLNGNREPPLEVIRRIAKECLGVTIGELIEDDPYFLTDENERELLDGFRSLEKEQQDLFRQIIATKKQNQK